MIKLLIVDDHAVIREGLRKLLSLDEDIQVLGTASHSDEAIRFISTFIVDIILLDISMPGRSGLEILPEIKHIQPEAKVIVLSMHKESQFVTRAIKSGASGYLTKELVSQEIIKAVKHVTSGGLYFFTGFEEISSIRK
jgi:two-component system, NarL family, invasion response regulator UvrY